MSAGEPSSRSRAPMLRAGSLICGDLFLQQQQQQQQQHAPSKAYPPAASNPIDSPIDVPVGPVRKCSHTPYSLSCSASECDDASNEASSDAEDNSFTPRKARSSPYNAIPEGVVHVAMVNHCEFLQPPNISPIERALPNKPTFHRFIGQVRFECTPGEMRWIIRRTCGVTALKLEPRGPGCFVAYFSTQEDAELVQQLNKRLLFDHTGVWFARTPAQTEIMQNYVHNSLIYAGRGFRLPRDTIVVEEEKGSRHSPDQQPSQVRSPLQTGTLPSWRKRFGRTSPPAMQACPPPPYAQQQQQDLESSWSSSPSQ